MCCPDELAAYAVGRRRRATAVGLLCLVLTSCTTELRFDAPAAAGGSSFAGAGGAGGAPSMPQGPAGPWLPLHTWEPRGEYMDESNVSVQGGHCVITAWCA